MGRPHEHVMAKSLFERWPRAYPGWCCEETELLWILWALEKKLDPIVWFCAGLSVGLRTAFLGAWQLDNVAPVCVGFMNTGKRFFYWTKSYTILDDYARLANYLDFPEKFWPAVPLPTSGAWAITNDQLYTLARNEKKADDILAAVLYKRGASWKV